MSRFYRELHDRELLNQAAAVLEEVHARKLIDVYLPADAQMQDEDTAIFPRRLGSLVVRNGRLALTVEPRFFRSAAR